MSKISVVINTRNEEENIEQAIKSVKSFADEIVVVDMKSSDNTVKIAKKLGAKVYDHEPMGYVEPARNFAISKATGEWILLLDADEEIPKSLAKRITDEIRKNNADYFAIPRKNIVFRKWIKHSRWWPDYNIRLFKKGRVSWSEIIHSVPETTGKGLDFEPVETNAILHHNYQSIEQYIERLNRYTSVQAKNLIDEKYKFHWYDLIEKPAEEFLSRYFAGQGYRDGVHGLALAMLQAFSELVLYLKIWQHKKFKVKEVGTKKVIKKMRDVQSDFSYWQADTLIKEGAGFTEKLKRKFKLR